MEKSKAEIRLTDSKSKKGRKKPPTRKELGLEDRRKFNGRPYNTTLYRHPITGEPEHKERHNISLTPTGWTYFQDVVGGSDAIEKECRPYYRKQAGLPVEGAEPVQPEPTDPDLSTPKQECEDTSADGDPGNDETPLPAKKRGAWHSRREIG